MHQTDLSPGPDPAGRPHPSTRPLLICAAVFVAFLIAIFGTAWATHRWSGPTSVPPELPPVAEGLHWETIIPKHHTIYRAVDREHGYVLYIRHNGDLQVVPLRGWAEPEDDK